MSRRISAKRFTPPQYMIGEAAGLGHGLQGAIPPASRKRERKTGPPVDLVLSPINKFLGIGCRALRCVALTAALVRPRFHDPNPARRILHRQRLKRRPDFKADNS